jgi:hypothetical protein
MKFIIRSYMDIAKEYKEGFGKKPTPTQLLNGCLIEESDFDRKVNSSGYWITPNAIYIDWDIMKNSDIKSKGSMSSFLSVVQSKLRSDFRESKLDSVLSQRN